MIREKFINFIFDGADLLDADGKELLKIKDEVNHPEHYTSGKYETIDIIKDSVDDFKSYVHGNIIKYILRYKKKGGVQDLKKAQIYLSWLIEEEEC